MTVYKNMAFGLMMRRKHGGWDNPLALLVAPGKYRHARRERKEINERVNGAAAMLGIEELLRRRPKELSGGQRQRVAVGRAIVREPKAFLFDEPLSNLDAKLRIETRGELKALHRRVQTTTIYVTHDQEEAMTLGDRVVVMKDGRVQQCATPFEVYEHPTNRFVAGFVGTPPMNFLSGQLVRDGERLAFDDGEQRLVLCPEHQGRLAEFADRPITIGIRPETLQPGDPSPGNSLRVQVGVVEPLGDRMDVLASTLRHERIVCRIDVRQRVHEREFVDMQVDMNRVHFFEPNGAGRNLSLPENVPWA
jgi:multiple sugar transport system ATP-binding protein